MSIIIWIEKRNGVCRATRYRNVAGTAAANRGR
jgi:hypothetical protein